MPWRTPRPVKAVKTKTSPWKETGLDAIGQIPASGEGRGNIFREILFVGQLSGPEFEIEHFSGVQRSPLDNQGRRLQPPLPRSSSQPFARPNAAPEECAV